MAATNQRLEDEVRKGKFREDLYYRLNVIRLEIPPLRERPEDIAPLSTSLLETYRTKYRRPAHPIPMEVMAAWERYSWPGNVRQLENVVKRFVILPDIALALGDLVEPLATPMLSTRDTRLHMPPESSGHTSPDTDQTSNAPRTAGSGDPNSRVSLKQVSAQAAEKAEKEVVLRTLDEMNWNRKRAARKLTISYKALLNKLRRWNIGGRNRGGGSGSEAEP